MTAVLFLLRAVVLVLLWGFVIAAIVAVRHDVFGTRRAVQPAVPRAAPPPKSERPSQPRKVKGVPRRLVVVDGMGGHAAGEVASRVVIEAVAALDQQPLDGDPAQALRSAVVTANEHLREMSSADRNLEGMGTTLTALLWTEDELRLVHI